MKILGLVLAFILCALTLCLAQEKRLLLSDFEGPICGGPDGTVDFGAGGGSSVDIAVARDIKYSGRQSLKITYDTVPGGYMWVARGFGLAAKNATWLAAPEEISWEKYNAFSFYVYGSNSQAQIAFDIKDNGNEMWRFLITDNFQGWKQIVCPLNEFFVRSDWQPDHTDKNGVLDIPIKSYQFEPRPQAKGILYVDCVELIER